MKQLLVAIDFSKTTDAVLEQALDLAMALEARLWILHVVSDQTQAAVYEYSQYPGYGSEFINMPGDVQLARNLSAEEFKREHTQLLHRSADLREKGADAQAILLKGNAADLILEKAAELQVEMLILGSHGHGLLHKALLGSVSEAVIRHAHCNVLLVPSPDGD